MQKKLTITIDEATYAGLHAVIGRGNISRFLEKIARPYLFSNELAAAWAMQSSDQVREHEANEWCDAVLGDLPRETW